MYGWTDLEASHQHREDLLREAEGRRLTRNLPGFWSRGRTRTLLLTVWGEMHRDIRRLSRFFRARPAHERTRKA